MKNNKTHWKIVGILGITQITSWGSMFYAFSLLAPEIQHGLGWRSEWAIAAFCLLYGLSNGILTIVRGTVPQTLFGGENYGALQERWPGRLYYPRRPVRW